MSRKVLGLQVLLLSMFFTRIEPIEASDGFVGVYFDSLGMVSCDSIPLYAAQTLYVMGKLDGASAEGIAAAEFRIEVTNPAGWILSYIPPPASNLVLGNPLDLDPGLDNSGAVIAFPSCQGAVDSLVELGTVFVYNVGGGQTALLVKKHNKPTNPTFQCARFVQCDTPTFTSHCMSPSSEPTCTIEKVMVKIGTDNAVSSASLNSGSETSGINSVSYFELMSFPGRLPARNAWSPTHSRLVFAGNNNDLYIYDASTPSEAPTFLGHDGSRYLTWSPDGDWVLYRYSSPENHRRGLAKLTASRVSSPMVEVLVQRGDIGTFLWGQTGVIHYWETLATKRKRTLSPPSSWNPMQYQFEQRSLVLTLPGPEMELVSFSETAPGIQVLSGMVGGDVRFALHEDSFPNSGKHLVSTYTMSTGVHTMVVDSQGNELVNLGNHRDMISFTGKSVSPDGMYVIGFDAVDDGEHLLYSKLYVAESSGAWKLPVENVEMGINPFYATNENIIAFEDPFSGVIHVGKIQVNY